MILKTLDILEGFIVYREPGSNRHRHKVRGILSPLRLPISPSRQQCKSDLKNKSLLRRRPDSNWWIAVLQTGALPLGYDAFNKKAPKTGPWAKERIWTVDPHVGNVMLYQLSYFRKLKKTSCYTAPYFTRIEELNPKIIYSILVIMSRVRISKGNCGLRCRKFCYFKFSRIDNF